MYSWHSKMAVLNINSLASATFTNTELVTSQRDESTQWQDHIFFTLSASYALLSAFALIQLIRIELRAHDYGWTTQKFFHLMNFIVNGVRAAIFGFHMYVVALKPKVLALVFLDFPVLLIFTTFTILVLFWAEIYYQAICLSIDKLRARYISVNCIIYVIQALIWMCIWMYDSSFVESIGQIFIAVVSFIVALGFLLYGGKLFSLLKSFPIKSKGRSKKLLEVGSVAVICCACFLIRCFMVVFAFDANGSLGILDHPTLHLIYYMAVEILPSAFVLFTLRKLPPKKESRIVD